MPATKDIAVYQGDSFSMFLRFRGKVWDAATSSYIPGPYTDLTGLTPKAEIRAKAGDAGEPLATLTCTLGDQTTPEGLGSVLCTLTPAQTAALPTGGGVYDLQLANGDQSDVTTYLKGKVTVETQVTV